MYDENYARSCSTSVLNTEPTEETPKPTGLENIPPEKLAEIQAYARRMRQKFPHMKAERMKRKVAEYFKIKLV